MPCGSHHREAGLSQPPEIAGLSAANKIEQVEAGHQPQIAHSGPQGGSVFPREHQPQNRLRPQKHHQRHEYPKSPQKPLSISEALPNPLLLPGPGVLSGKDGHRRRAAVPEGVGKSLYLEDFFSWRDLWPDSWAIAPAVAAVPLARKLGLTLRSLENGPASEIIYYLQGPRRKEVLLQVFLDCLERELERRPEVESLLAKSRQT